MFYILLLSCLLQVIRPHFINISDQWKQLNSLYRKGALDDISALSEEIAITATPKGAAQLVENAVMTWADPRYAGAVASALSGVISKSRDLFVKVSVTIVRTHPEAPVTSLLAPYLRDKEHLLEDPVDWIKLYLKLMSGAKCSRCVPGESRDCGDFQKNLLWTLKTFPESFPSISKWVMDWAESIYEDKKPFYMLKYIYVRFFPAIILMKVPESLDSLSMDSEFSQLMSEQYLKLSLRDRLEVMEYSLWFFQEGDIVLNISRDLINVYKWILNYMVIPGGQECTEAIEILARSDAFRTLSLVWQLKHCSANIDRSSTFIALESKAPFCFAVYLTHGHAVRRHVLQTHNISELYRLMLSILPKKKQGETMWNPCTTSSHSVAQRYMWIPPVNIGDLSAPSVLLLVRFLLYIQFGVPFDDTRTNVKRYHEALHWPELPGIATAFLERHCQLNNMYSIYRISIEDLPHNSLQGSTAEGSESVTSSTDVSLHSESDTSTGNDRVPRVPNNSDASTEISEETPARNTFDGNSNIANVDNDLIWSDDFSSMGEDPWVSAQKLSRQVLIRIYDDDSVESDDSDDNSDASDNSDDFDDKMNSSFDNSSEDADEDDSFFDDYESDESSSDHSDNSDDSENFEEETSSDIYSDPASNDVTLTNLTEAKDPLGNATLPSTQQLLGAIVDLDASSSDQPDEEGEDEEVIVEIDEEQAKEIDSSKIIA